MCPDARPPPTSQFSTNDMDQLLEQYGSTVLKPHERYTPQDVSRPECAALRCRSPLGMATK